MKIAVIGANGNSGKLITEEAITKGHDVTAIVRSENKSLAKNIIKKDLFDLTKEDLTEFDAVISTFAAWQEESLSLHSKAIEHLTTLLAGTDTRLLVVGGAGSLYIDDNLTTRLFETPTFPAEYKPLATAMGESLELLRSKNDVNWTYISPAADFVADGEKTGQYIVAGEVFSTNDKGISQISYADYAIAMIDELEKGNNIKKRISVLGV